MMKKFLLGAGILTLAFATPAMACAEGADSKDGHGKHKMMERVDKNQDGVLTQDEFLDEAKERFTVIDADGDGKVTREEMKEKRKAAGGDTVGEDGAAPETQAETETQPEAGAE